MFETNLRRARRAHERWGSGKASLSGAASPGPQRTPHGQAGRAPGHPLLEALERPPERVVDRLRVDLVRAGAAHPQSVARRRERPGRAQPPKQEVLGRLRRRHQVPAAHPRGDALHRLLEGDPGELGLPREGEGGVVRRPDGDDDAAVGPAGGAAAEGHAVDAQLERVRARRHDLGMGLGPERLVVWRCSFLSRRLVMLRPPRLAAGAHAERVARACPVGSRGLRLGRGPLGHELVVRHGNLPDGRTDAPVALVTAGAPPPLSRRTARARAFPSPRFTSSLASPSWRPSMRSCGCSTRRPTEHPCGETATPSARSWR